LPSPDLGLAIPKMLIQSDEVKLVGSADFRRAHHAPDLLPTPPKFDPWRPDLGVGEYLSKDEYFYVYRHREMV
jgi:hypothetical protein